MNIDLMFLEITSHYIMKAINIILSRLIILMAYIKLLVVKRK